MSRAAQVFISLLLSVSAAMACPVLAASVTALPLTWYFDADLAGTLPEDFSIGTLFDGRPAGNERSFKLIGPRVRPRCLASSWAKAQNTPTRSSSSMTSPPPILIFKSPSWSLVGKPIGEEVSSGEPPETGTTL